MDKQRIHISQLLAFTFFAFASCGGSKQVAVQQKEVVEAVSSQKPKTLNSTLFQLWRSEVPYVDLTCKANFEISSASGSTRSISGVVKLQYNKCMQLSFRVLGIEGMRITLTPDSIFLIDRLHRQIAVESTASVEQKYHFNFYNLQAIVDNRLLQLGSETIDSACINQAKITVEDKRYVARTRDFDTETAFIYSGNNMLLQTRLSAPQQQLNVEYSRFINSDSRIYPTIINIDFSIPKTVMKLAIEYDKIDFDTSLEIDSALPQKYTRTTAKKVIDNYLN